MSEFLDIKKEPQLFSQKGIAIATFLGSPLAAGILIRQNYIALEERSNGNRALIIGIVSTIILFGLLLTLPENIVDKMPSQLLPAIYMGVIYWIMQKLHGAVFKKYEADGHTYRSNWKAAGIGLLCTIVMAGLFLVYVFYGPEDPIYVEYEKVYENFSNNELATFEFYDHYEVNTINELLTELDQVCIPKWEENREMVLEASKIEALPADLIQRNETLLEYCDLRIDEFTTYKKELQSNEVDYHDYLEALYQKITEKTAELE